MKMPGGLRSVIFSTLQHPSIMGQETNLVVVCKGNGMTPIKVVLNTEMDDQEWHTQAEHREATQYTMDGKIL